MGFKIGFNAEQAEQKLVSAEYTVPQTTYVPRRSVVQVSFDGRSGTLAYYNYKFDLHRGDMVYVDGKLEGRRGRIVDVNYNFKIRLSDYKRVIGVADRRVNGQFFMADSHLVTFERMALPAGKVITWFKAPCREDEEFVSGSDDSAFHLDCLNGMQVNPAAAERGHAYYMENRVRYISVDGTRGFAIVEGSRAYEVEFEHVNGEISHLVCSCFCSYNCKHEFAAMLQLKETLEIIDERYADKFQNSGYFAAVNKAALFAFAVEGRETGSIIF